MESSAFLCELCVLCGNLGVSLATSLRKMWIAKFRMTLATEYTEGTESHE
jgi:hypothetical protein